MKIVRILLAAGAQPDGALVTSTSSIGNTEITRRLLAAPSTGNADSKALLDAIRRFDPNAEKGSDARVGDEAAYGEVALALLEGGADPNSVGPNGETALHIASSRRALKIVEALVKKGAYVSRVTVDGDTPPATRRGRMGD